MGRAPCCDKTKVKRGPWSPGEDNLLKTYLDKYGSAGNWIALPQKAGLKRCGKSCRLRWLNYLRPNIKHGGFTEEEDNIILTLYSHIGSRWSVIASHLQGRTDNDVKNYWNTKLKKKHLKAATTTTLSSSNSNAFPHENYTMNTIPRTCYGIDYTTCSVMNSNAFINAMDANFCSYSSCQFRLPELMEIQENAALQPAEDLVKASFASFSGNIGVGKEEEYGSLMALRCGMSSSYYYDLVNSFNFQDYVMGNNYNPNLSNSSYYDLLQLQADIPDTDQVPFKGFETYIN